MNKVVKIKIQKKVEEKVAEKDHKQVNDFTNIQEIYHLRNSKLQTYSTRK